MRIRFEEEMKKERRRKIVKELVIFLLLAVVVVFLAWIIIHYAMKKVSVIGSAMETTLYNGEDVIVNKTSYVIFSPKREQIIAFYPESDDENEVSESDSDILIRRVIGLPGEKVSIRDGKVYIDGQECKEKYDFPLMKSGGSASEEVTLGEDEYFVLSDNRNDMDDSRNPSFTKVKEENIIGKVLLRFSPFSLLGGPEEQKTNQEEEGEE